MASLYEIDQRLLNLYAYGVDTDTGEVAVSEEDFQRMFEDIQMDMETKFVNTACYIKNLRSDAAQIKAEEDRLKKRRQAKENFADRLERSMDTMIKYHMYNIEDDNDFKIVNGWTIDKPQARLSYRKSTKLDVYDENAVPDDYKTKLEVVKVDADMIKKDIKNGVEVEGARLVNNLNLQIR